MKASHPYFVNVALPIPLKKLLGEVNKLNFL